MLSVIWSLIDHPRNPRYCHYLLTLMSFQTCMIFFSVENKIRYFGKCVSVFFLFFFWCSNWKAVWYNVVLDTIPFIVWTKTTQTSGCYIWPRGWVTQNLTKHWKNNPPKMTQKAQPSVWVKIIIQDLLESRHSKIIVTSPYKNKLWRSYEAFPVSVQGLLHTAQYTPEAPQSCKPYAGRKMPTSTARLANGNLILTWSHYSEIMKPLALFSQHGQHACSHTNSFYFHSTLG